MEALGQHFAVQVWRGEILCHEAEDLVPEELPPGILGLGLRVGVGGEVRSDILEEGIQQPWSAGKMTVGADGERNLVQCRDDGFPDRIDGGVAFLFFLVRMKKNIFKKLFLDKTFVNVGAVYGTVNLILIMMK